ncbi:MAG: response regulator transcription factor [Congregibacter sp.]
MPALPQHTSPPNILIVEDDADIARLIALHLEDLDAQVRHADRGDEALQLALSKSWDLIILDLRLPGISGLDICRRLREQGRLMPILMLTAKSSELDRVLGLELGADDYLTKPFSPLELSARVKALLRRAAMNKQLEHKSAAELADEAALELGPFSICTRSHSVTLHKQPVELTSREFDLLLHFARQPGRVFRRTELLDEVWGYGHEGYEHTVNTHINRLRRKIEVDPGSPRHVVTVWGVGYRFEACA